MLDSSIFACKDMFLQVDISSPFPFSHICFCFSSASLVTCFYINSNTECPTIRTNIFRLCMSKREKGKECIHNHEFMSKVDHDKIKI